jgi:hypothetical protein
MMDSLLLVPRLGLTGSPLEIRSFLDPWQGGLVLAGYVVVLVAAGVLATRRRDVS